jgi:oligopeptide/dipeptide ABC transporter ATP-binding protein
VPRRGDTRGALVAIPGTPPDPARLPTGCAFHPRCPRAEDRCRDEIPALRVLSPEHRAACLFAERVSHS